MFPTMVENALAASEGIESAPPPLGSDTNDENDSLRETPASSFRKSPNGRQSSSPTD
jgi:hypothetical protein